MESIDPGHQYALLDYAGVSDSLILTFYKKIKMPNGNYREESGTTNEAVLEVLIDRLRYLNAIMPSIYNEDAIDHLRHALQCLNDRTEDRIAREVEGTDKE